MVALRYQLLQRRAIHRRRYAVHLSHWLLGVSSRQPFFGAAGSLSVSCTPRSQLWLCPLVQDFPANPRTCFAWAAAGVMHLIPHCLEARAALVPAGSEHQHAAAEDPLALVLIVVGYCLVFYMDRVLFDGHGGHGHGHGHGAGEPCKGHEHEQKEKASSKRATRASAAGSSSSAPEAPSLKFAGGLVLLAAMSFHTALECLALGVIRRRSDFWVLFGAISSHKAVSALALSSRFLAEGASTADLLAYVAPFALVPPAAIVFGLSVGAVDPLLSLVLSCFAAGTFLYVGASEVLTEEFEGDVRAGRRDISPRMARHIKFFAVLVAVGFTAAMAVLLPHSHGGHDHEHHDHDHAS